MLYTWVNPFFRFFSFFAGTDVSFLLRKLTNHDRVGETTLILDANLMHDKPMNQGLGRYVLAGWLPGSERDQLATGGPIVLFGQGGRLRVISILDTERRTQPERGTLLFRVQREERERKERQKTPKSPCTYSTYTALRDIETQMTGTKWLS